MSQALYDFFAQVSADEALQARLYVTKELTDVAAIAQEMGFNVSGAEILRAQAGRLLLLSPQELEEVAAGKRPKTGAQWGRAGKGYLDQAGFWINEFIQWNCTQPANEPQLDSFFAKIKTDQTLQAELLLAKTYNDVVSTAKKHGYQVLASTMLRFIASQILMLSEEKAEKVASGA